jgi:hypothetical protein
MTGLDATAYWKSYYAEEFIFGLGTEKIVELLREVPPVDTWIDVGSGSESLLWGCALDERQLMAVDADPDRLALLRTYAATTDEPRGSYRTVLELCDRPTSAWQEICSRLRSTHVADCLTGDVPVPDRAELVTQFGLLGLCPDETSFRRCLTALATLVSPGGWFVGANWMAAEHAGRVVLTEDLYRNALLDSGAEIVRLAGIESADPTYPYIWTYLARLP